MSSRTFSYSNQFNTSASVILLSLMSILDGETVGFREDTDGVVRDDASSLVDLQRGQWTVGGYAVRCRGRDVPEQRLGELHRQLEVLFLHPPSTVDAGALLDGLD